MSYVSVLRIFSESYFTRVRIPTLGKSPLSPLIRRFPIYYPYRNRYIRSITGECSSTRFQLRRRRRPAHRPFLLSLSLYRYRHWNLIRQDDVYSDISTIERGISASDVEGNIRDTISTPSRHRAPFSSDGAAAAEVI